MVRSRIAQVLRNSVSASVGVEGGLSDLLASSSGNFARGCQIRLGCIRLVTTGPQLRTGSSRRASRWRVQQRAYSAVGHELPIFDTHHVFRIVATCSVVAALSNAWFSGSGLFGDVSTHIALLRGNPQMRKAGLERMQMLIVRKDEAACFQELKDCNAFLALVELMRLENDIDVWRQLCRTVVDICDSPVLYRGLVSSNVCSVLSERVASGDEEFRSAAAVLVHKLVFLSGKL